MDFIGPLIQQGGLGLLAAVGFTLFYQERKEHREDNKTKDAEIRALQDDRLAESRGSIKEVTGVLNETAQAMRILSEKIEIGKQIGSRH